MNIGLSHRQINSNNSTKLFAGADLIQDELMLLLNMPKHSLFFGNNMGLDLEKYLHMRNREALYHMVREDIVEVLQKYGKVVLQELQVVVTQNNKLDILVVVRVKDTGQNIVIPLSVGEV